MDVELRKSTHAGRKLVSEQSDGSDGTADSIDELFREWKAQHTAFGWVLVAYAFLISVAPLIARHPDETLQIICTSLRHVVDGRAWVLSASVACLIALVVTALKRRR